MLWDNWGDERGCDEGHWHAHTRGSPCGLPEVPFRIFQKQWSKFRQFVQPFLNLPKAELYLAFLTRVWTSFQLFNSWRFVGGLIKDLQWSRFISEVIVYLREWNFWFICVINLTHAIMKANKKKEKNLKTLWRLVSFILGILRECEEMFFPSFL